MVIITEKIQPKNFERVRDLIGVILTEEITNQKVLWEIENEISVYSERSTPVTQEEEIIINVLLSGANYSGLTQQNVQGRTSFYIDVYASLEAETGKIKGENSANFLHKVIGWITHVLSLSDYKTLGIPMSEGVIGNTSVDDFEVLTPSLVQDSSFFRMSRINFSVKIMENTPLEKGSEFLGNSTSVKLNLTEKGYKYEF